MIESKINKLIFGSLVVILFSCAYNKENLPEPMYDGPVVTYTGFAKEVIHNECISCHSSSGTGQFPFLETYVQVNQQAEAGRIRARAIDGPSFMPLSGILPQTTRDTLLMWILQGSPE